MNFLQAGTIKELQLRGSFKEVRKKIQNDLGERVKLKARSWKDLLEVVNHFHNLLESQSKICIDKSENIESVSSDSLYFLSESTQIIYALVRLDGEQRLKELGIDRSYYKDSEKAKKWRNRTAMMIHPDKCKHPFAEIATDKLVELFNNMIGK